MTVTSRRKLPAAVTSDAAAGPGDLEARVAELESMLTLMTKFAAALAVRVSETRARATSASFRDIAVTELRLGQHHDVDKIEAWLKEHGS